MKRRKVVVFSLSVACLGLVATTAVAAPPGASHAPSKASTDGRRSKLVQVYVAGAPETVARTRVAVQELLSRLELPTIVRDAAGADEELLTGDRSAAMVNAYVDLRSLDSPRVIVLDGETGQELERRTLPAAASMETAVEASAHVLYMSVESVMRAREDESLPPATEAKPEPPAPPPEPADPSPTTAVDAGPGSDAKTSRSGAKTDPGWGASAGVFGTAVSFGASRVLAGVGGTVEVAPRAFTVRPGILASFALYLPGDVGRPDASGSVEGMGARVLPFVEWVAANKLALYGAVGGGVDYVRFDPEKSPPGASALGKLGSADPVVSAQIGLKLRLARALCAVVGAGLDVDLLPRRYVAENAPGQRETVFELSSVRPLGFVGLSYSFAGTTPFGARGQ